ncbi:MAG TPA: DUF2934 domain-containing protein [Bauldia sp.]|nr:DUF2934 domain-containing protein [Bauldia sp.]
MTPDETRVRIRAYAIWEAEGRPHGRDEAHWLEAVRQLLAEEAADVAIPAKPAKAPAKKVAAAKPAKAEAKPVAEAPKKVARLAPVEAVPPATKKPARAKVSPAP